MINFVTRLLKDRSKAAFGLILATITLDAVGIDEHRIVLGRADGDQPARLSRRLGMERRRARAQQRQCQQQATGG